MSPSHWVVTLISRQNTDVLFSDIEQTINRHQLTCVSTSANEMLDGFYIQKLRLKGPSSLLAYALRAQLEAIAPDLDVAIQKAEVFDAQGPRLFAFDMDSTLIQIEVIDELARLHGVGEQVAEVTQRAMAGDLNFDASLIERVALLNGLAVEKTLALAEKLPLMHGAETLMQTLKAKGHRTAVLSGGFTFATHVLQKRLKLDHAFANTLEVSDGKLTGRVTPPIINAQKKADLLFELSNQEGIPMLRTVAVGDGANDLPMLASAGLGVAFHAKPKVKEVTSASLGLGGLDHLLHLIK